jgi:hypothetical protein
LGVNTLKVANKNDMCSFLLYSAYREHLQVRDALGKKANASPLKLIAIIGSWIMK